MRLSKEWKNKIPKGYFRAVQKAVNDKLKEVSISADWLYGDWSGYTANQFKYRIRVFKKVIKIHVYIIIRPPVTKEEINKFFYSISRYRKNNISFKLAFRKAYGGSPAHYRLRFPIVSVSVQQKQIKKNMSHRMIIDRIDKELMILLV